MRVQYSTELMLEVARAYPSENIWDKAVRGAIERGDAHAHQLMGIPAMMTPAAICTAFSDNRAEDVLALASEIVIKTSLRNRCCDEAGG